jgi:3,4-dihydroxy 2-butanone 4-phosphate synthase/GTP cyclohydrolase II
MPFAPIADAIEAIRRGQMVVVVDDEDRENEGDITIAAEFASPEAINFMAVHGRGLICLALDEAGCDRLGLPMMSQRNTSQFGTAFCEAIDAAEGVTTGISAADRARTVQVAIDPASGPADLARPGHMFPLRARAGGVLVRTGQTEAAVDLATLAGLRPGGVICEVMNEDGTMSRVPQLVEFCHKHGLLLISVADLIRYRLAHERTIRRGEEGSLTTPLGQFRTISYSSSISPDTHLALIYGEPGRTEPALVRMHSRCTDGDVFGSTACDCHRLLNASLARIVEAGSGVLVYLHHSGPALAARHASPPEAGQLQHESGLGAQILADLGLARIRLLTNHRRKIVGLEGFGIELVEQLPV